MSSVSPRGLSRASAGKRDLDIYSEKDLCTHKRDLHILRTDLYTHSFWKRPVHTRCTLSFREDCREPMQVKERYIYSKETYVHWKETCTYVVHALIPRGLSRANAGKRELYILKRDLCTHERDLCIIWQNEFCHSERIVESLCRLKRYIHTLCTEKRPVYTLKTRLYSQKRPINTHKRDL